MTALNVGLIIGAALGVARRQFTEAWDRHPPVLPAATEGARAAGRRHRTAPRLPPRAAAHLGGVAVRTPAAARMLEWPLVLARVAWAASLWRWSWGSR